MRRRAWRTRSLISGALIVLALLLAPAAAEAATLISCEGGSVTLRDGRSCIICHYTICCILYPDGNLDCWSTVDDCWDCGGGAM